MRSEYVNLVTIDGEDGHKYIRTAPWLGTPSLEIGDYVMFQVDGHPFEIKGNVIDIGTFSVNGEQYRVLTSYVKDAKMRVTKKIIMEVLDFSDYDKEGEEENG